MDDIPKSFRGFDRNDFGWKGKGHRTVKTVFVPSTATFQNYIWEDEAFWNDQNVWKENQ